MYEVDLYRRVRLACHREKMIKGLLMMRCMSVHGYTRTNRGAASHVCLPPDSRHSRR